MPNFIVPLLRIVVLYPLRIGLWCLRILQWIIAPFALVVQFLIGVPLAMIRERRPTHPRFVAVPEKDLPNAVWVNFANTREALEKDGFILSGDFQAQNLLEQGTKTVWLRLLVHPEHHIIAWVTHTEEKQPFRHRSPHGLEFNSFFEDSRVLVTHNLNKPPHFPTPHFLARLQLTEVWDPRALYILHRDFVSTLKKRCDTVLTRQAIDMPQTFLAACAMVEINALLKEGWLHPVAGQKEMARLSFMGAVVYVWHRAWPLSGVHLRAMDRHAHDLCKANGLTVEPFVGSPATIIVEQYPLRSLAFVDPEKATISACYHYVRVLARGIDTGALLESVNVELYQNANNQPVPREFRYSFRAYDDVPSRRIRRRRHFDVLLDPVAEELAITVTVHHHEEAADSTEWERLTSRSIPPTLRLGPWLYDLDVILPLALKIQESGHVRRTHQLEWASLYMDEEEGLVYWQLTFDDPKRVSPQENLLVNARTGRLLEG